MTAKLKTILLITVLFASSAAFAQKATDNPRIKLGGKGRSLVLTSGRVRRAFDMREQLHAARLDEVKLLLVTRRDSFIYLVVDACGPSKAVPDARQCGAADECGLLWVKLDAAWKLSEVKSARYESCWQSSSSADGYKISNRQLRMEYDDFSGRKRYKLFYDAEQPERGFILEESPMEDRAGK